MSKPIALLKNAASLLGNLLKNKLPKIFICFCTTLNITFSLHTDHALADDKVVSLVPETKPETNNSFLQGGIQTTELIPNKVNCSINQGLSSYQKGFELLDQENYKAAADYFRMSGDQTEASQGECKFLAEARFAEAQTRRLMGQLDKARSLYQAAIDIFKRQDPKNFYLKAAQQGLKELGGAQKDNAEPLKGKVTSTGATKLKAMSIPGIQSVSSDYPLSGQITELDNGIDITTLKDGDFFNRSRGTLTQTAACDISDNFVKDTIHKVFLKMNCLETSSVGATNYTAPLFYKSIKSNGKPLAVGVGTDLLSPVAELMLNGKLYKVAMDLPNISPNSRNVLLVTDGNHVLAIDPRTSEAWKLCANFAKKIPDFSWWKLGRLKGRKYS